jgi:hypothetical protein
MNNKDKQIEELKRKNQILSNVLRVYEEQNKKLQKENEILKNSSCVRCGSINRAYDPIRHCISYGS